MLHTYWRDLGITALTAMAFFTLLGSALATRALSGLPPLVRALLAPLLGFGAWTGFSVALFYLIPFRSGLAAAVAGVVLALVWLLARPVRVGPVRAWAGLAALCGGIAILPMLPIAPVEYRDGLFFAEPIFDHMKVALVDAIHRHGVPPRSPYYSPGEPVAINYYFGWYVVAATLRVLPNVSGFIADAALTYCTAWISLLAMAGLALLIGGKRRTAYLAPLVALPLGLDEALRWMIGAPYQDFIGAEHGLENWLVQATWVPQHLFSGATVVLVILLLVELIRNTAARWVIAPLLGLLASASIVSSIWAGAFGLAGAFLPLTIAVLSTPEARVRLRSALAPLALAMGVAAMAVAPFIRTLLSFETPGSRSPVGFWLFPTLQVVLQEDAFGYICHFLAYWTLFACIQFGAIYFVGWTGLLMGRDGMWSSTRLFRRMSIAVIVANLSVAQFMKSVIVNNDLGWRVVLPAVLLLCVWTTATLSGWVDALRNSRQGATFQRALCGVVVASVVAGMGLVASLRFASTAYSGRDRDRTDKSLKHDLQRMPEAWATVRSFTGPQDIVAMNPVSFERITSWEANAAAALFSDRLQLVSDDNWPMVYSHHVERRKFQTDFNFLKRVFNEGASANELMTLAIRYHVQALLVFPRDSLWNSAPLADNPYYSEAYASPEYRVYKRKQ